MLRLCFFLFFVYLFSLSSYSQIPTRATDLLVLGKIERYLEITDSIIFKKGLIFYSTNQVPILDTSVIFDSSVVKLVAMRKSAYNAKTGLSLQLMYNNQFGAYNIDYMDEDNIFPYNNKFQASLNWNITKSSLIGRKAAHKIIEVEGMQASLLFQEDDLRFLKNENLLETEDKWDLIINFIYLERLNLLNELFRLREYLYASKRVLYSDIAFVQREIFIVKSLMTNHDSLSIVEPMHQIDLHSYQSSLLFDTSGLFDTYLYNNIGLTKYTLQHERLSLSKKSLSYIKQMDIKLFVKAQYYDRVSDGEFQGGEFQGKMDVGISATFPLSVEYRREKKVIDYEAVLNHREEFYAKEHVIAQYNKKIGQLIQINNELMQNVLALKPIEQNIINYKAMYQNNVSSLEKLLFEYDAYLVLLSNVYLIIKEREMLIAKLLN